ncbi:MAG: N-6 DNA methylase [Verrucomicrobiota bacterium]|nr:N-6 DNA methylase [Verrucomicrobiota bacterium]
MPRNSQIRMHELEFCSEVKSFCDALFTTHPEWPFSHATIEQYGRGNYRRSDLRFFQRGSQTPVLCGEVKMPGTPEGRSPYDAALMQDAFQKADNIQCPYFFTWNVNTFVLFDRSKWQAPMIERRVRPWDLNLQLRRAADCRRPEVLPTIRDRFLPELFALLAHILIHKKTDWGLTPDAAFIHSLESHLDWPVVGTSDYLAETCRTDRSSSARLQAWLAGDMGWTFDPDNADDWRRTLDRAARTLCYVFCNRAIFYEAIRARYPGNLTALSMPSGSRHGHEGIYQYFRGQFHQAVIESCDYEPIFYPDVEDRVGSLVFASPMARQGWRGVFANLEHYNFRDIPYDIIGGIFQRLIAPEERRKFGQFFTNEDIADIINAFCIHRAGDKVMDPACGSGSFLIRAYYRKGWLAERRRARQRTADSHRHHQELLTDIYGCDIALFAAHPATLNLAARQIHEEENYPHIARGNFFEVIEHRDNFCRVPSALRNADGSRGRVAVPLPRVDAVVGNPPYVRQESIEKRSELKRRADESKTEFEGRRKNTKEHFQELCSRLWPGLKLTGRSDLHCYFWPAAASLLNENGYFGFLTSSSWLDVEYGFALQRWILQNFKLLAVIESLDEPWFPDARVKTAITILQRCSDGERRMANLTRFVRLLKPVAEILGDDRPAGDESARQKAAEQLRSRILNVDSPNKPYADALLRVMPVPQRQLWDEGVRAGWLFWDEDFDSNDVHKDEDTEPGRVKETHAMYEIGRGYVAGKWGRFIRAPDLYFRLIREYGDRFVRLGEVAEIKRGITSGCDAFFMPRDVTEEVLAELAKGLPWRDVGLLTPCKLKELEEGKVRIVRAGDNTLHPIEREFVRPEVHSLMEVDRPVIRTADRNRVVLWVNQELQEIAHTYAAKYIRWGARGTFASKKSKPVKLPERSTCAARPLWHDLTNIETGLVFWPMAQKYRHIVPLNPDKLVCNHNLFYVSPRSLNSQERTVLAAVLNSTILALMKCFYGRYAGTEGTLKTEVVDTVLLEVPDPRGVSPALAQRMSEALGAMACRDVTHLVQESMLRCHSEQHMREILARPVELSRELQQSDRRMLDDAVFEMIGVNDATHRARTLDELYIETARYYRYQRAQDIQTSENRAEAGRGQIGPRDLAASVWDSLSAEEKGQPVADWIKDRWDDTVTVEIPDGKPSALGSDDMFDPSAVAFRQGANGIKRAYANPGQAALVATLADLEIRGEVAVPQSAQECRECRQELQKRLNAARQRFTELAASRTGQVPMQERVVFTLIHWHTHGQD